MRKVLLATIAAAAFIAPAQANDFWNIAGGIVVGGLVLDGLRDRHREEIYYVDPPPPPQRKVIHCHDEFTLDRFNRKHWYKVCYEEWEPAY
jgi:hypothetical protein